MVLNNLHISPTYNYIITTKEIVLLLQYWKERNHDTDKLIVSDRPGSMPGL